MKVNGKMFIPVFFSLQMEVEEDIDLSDVDLDDLGDVKEEL